MKKLINSIGIMITALCGLAYADEGVSLAPIVVTPYRMETLSEFSGAAVETIDAGQLQDKGVGVLKNALRGSPSIDVASSGSLGGDTSIFLRGHNSNHVRLMLDGVKLYDPMITTAYYNFSHIDLSGIETIEISKGPQSSLYGSDAIGGVINLLTKRGQGRPRFTFRQTMGSYNTYRESLDCSGSKGRLGYFANVSRSDIGGYSLAKEKNNNHERDPYHNLNATLRLDYDVSDKTSIGLLGRYIYAKYEYDGSSWTPPYLPTDDNDNYAYDYEGVYGISGRHAITDALTYNIKVAQTSLNRKSWEDAASDSWYTGRTSQVDNQFTYKICDFYTIVSGFDYLREVGDSFRVDGGFVSDFPKAVAHNRGFFVENIFNPFDWMFLSGSYRRDDHSVFQWQDTYHLSASLRCAPAKTRLRLSCGTGFKAPSLYQLYAPTTAWGPIGNANLKPEESKSWEAGLQNTYIDKLALSATYFKTGLKNLINFDNLLGYMNIGKARIEGVETGFTYQIAKPLSLGVTYSWLNTENQDTHVDLARRPANKVTGKFSYRISKWAAYLDLSYVGHRTSDTEGIQMLKSYILANAAAEYFLSESLTVFTRLENLLDDKYELITGYQTPKLSAYGGIKVEF